MITISLMFIREVKKKIKKQDGQYHYIHHRLIESFRTPHGPRQKVLLDLGTLDINKNDFKTLANMIEGYILEDVQQNLFEQDPKLVAMARNFAEQLIRKRTQQKKTSASNPQNISHTENKEPKERYETVDLNSITTCHSKTIGSEHIALTQLRELSFFEILKKQGWNQKKINLAAAQICARLIHPTSERETARWLRQNSALDELLGEDFSKISDHILHRTADALLSEKESLEKALAERTRDLFSLAETIILYDLTNTYFESSKLTSQIARFGKSKEKRNDCPLVTLALIVDSEGFPKRSKIFKGNISEPGTLWKIIQELGDDYNDDTKPKTVVMDAGIATEDNLQRLREDDRFEYVAISRRRKIDQKLFEQATAKKLILSKKKELTVKMAKVGSESFLLCQSPDRLRRDKDILNQRKQRFEKALNFLNEGLKKPRTQKEYARICERIGRLKERYKVGHLYTIKVEQESGNATKIIYTCHRNETPEMGHYVIRTSRTDLVQEQLSSIHRSLTMIESAFRWLKSDLGMQPNFHQRDKRIESHIFISVLAYFVLAPILKKLEWGGSFVGHNNLQAKSLIDWEKPYGWKTLNRVMASQVRITTTFTCQDGHRLDVRTTMNPTAEQRELYQRLKMAHRPLARIIYKHGETAKNLKTVVPKNIAGKS